MSLAPFRRLAVPFGTSDAPALVRLATFDPFGELATPSDILGTYPRLSLYGGPARIGDFETPQGEALIQAWIAMLLHRYRMHAVSELVPIIPSGWPPNSTAPAWDSRWQWRWIREQGPATRWRLVRASPVQWTWRPA